LSFLGFTVVEVRTHILSGLTASTTNSTFNYERDIAGEDPLAQATATTAVEKDLRTIPGLGQIASSASLSGAAPA